MVVKSLLSRHAHCSLQESIDLSKCGDLVLEVRKA